MGAPLTTSPAGPTGSASLRPVTLRIGRLDADSTSHARCLLSELVTQPGTALTVDLTHMDRGHELTLDALLAEAAARTAGTTTTLTVLRPTERLATSLSASGIPVQRSRVDAAPGADTEVFEVGAFPVPADPWPEVAPVELTSHHGEIFDVDGAGERHSTRRCLCGNRWPCEDALGSG